MEFNNVIKSEFYHNGTDVGTVTSRIPLLDANGNVSGSCSISDLAQIAKQMMTFRIDDTIDTPQSKITNANNEVAKLIRANTHRYLMKKTGEGTAAICQLSDSNSALFFDGTTAADLSGAQGDVIVKFPKFYYEVTETSQGSHVWDIMLSLSNTTGTMMEWDDRQVLGAYEAYMDNDKLYSISGVSPTVNTSRAVFRQAANARGDGYTLTKWQQHNIIALLFYAMYGTTNCQSVCGSGTSSTKITGGTNYLGMTDTDTSNGNSGSVSFLGIENCWGNQNEFIDNVSSNYSSSDFYIVITEDDGTQRTVHGFNDTSAGAFYPTKMVLGSYFDLVPSQDSLKVDSETGYCDLVTIATSVSRNVLVSGTTAKLTGNGVSYANFDAASSMASTRGARLAFKGNLTEYTNITNFKNLPVL